MPVQGATVTFTQSSEQGQTPFWGTTEASREVPAYPVPVSCTRKQSYVLQTYCVVLLSVTARWPDEQNAAGTL